MSEVKSNGKRKQRFAKVAKKSTDSSTDKKKSSLEAAAAELMKKQSVSSQPHQLQQQGPPALPCPNRKGLNRLSLTDSDPLAVTSPDSSLAKKNMWSAKKSLLKSVRLSPRPVRKDSWSSKAPQPDIDLAELNSLYNRMNRVEETLKGHLDELHRFVFNYVVKDPKLATMPPREMTVPQLLDCNGSRKDLVNFLIE